MIEDPPLLTISRNRPRPTDAQIAAFQGVPTGFVNDAMFGKGALARQVRPIGEGRDLKCAAAGPALTVDNGPGDVLALMAALSQIQEGDMVMSAFDGFQGCAAAGDRLAGMMRNNGAVGYVTDGPMRDYDGIVAAGLPCWCTGLTPASPFTKGPGRVGLPIEMAGQHIESGDMVVADIDGVVVVPFAQIDAVIAVLDKVRTTEAALDARVEAGLDMPDAIRALLDTEGVKYIG
ncbi:RraA family protein [Oceaniglobus trochenteri]|uniref:RraA family protein n=1 Tax=Oceaniglobus trochenteri TaxID=2763260 RepID=UPI001CFFB6EE|nr:RraA family protein [Oceaniglobus trochenteri]